MAEQVLARVLFGEKTLRKDSVHYKEGTLKDYRRYKLQGRDYPGISPAQGETVKGRLIYNVDDESLKRLDFFEAEEYTRERVKVQSDEGEVEAWAYVWNDKSLIIPEEWEFDNFRQNRMNNWISDELGESEGLGGRFWNDYNTQPEGAN